MARAKYEFTNITRLQPEALGEPGQRTFRILADSGSSSAAMWLEKEQLSQLALAIQQLIATLPEEEEGTRGELPSNEAPGLTNLDFKIGKLVLGHDGSNGLFLIDVHDLESEDREAATVRVWVDKAHMSEFAEETMRVCAAGRPLCPLCGRAMDPEGHRCSRVNGHGSTADL